jgi:hypothetical protein
MRSLFFGIFILFNSSLFAEEVFKRHELWTFYMDNDMLSHDACQFMDWCAESEDRNYTGGFGLGFKINPKYRGEFTDLIRRVHDTSDGDHEMVNDGVQYDNYGFTAFTPDMEDQVDLNNDGNMDPIIGDRPFSAMWFYTSTIAIDVTKSDEKPNARRTQLTISLLRADIGYDLQQFIHCHLGRGNCPVRGWENNINDGYDIAFSVGKSYIY